MNKYFKYVIENYFNELNEALTPQGIRGVSFELIEKLYGSNIKDACIAIYEAFAITYNEKNKTNILTYGGVTAGSIQIKEPNTDTNPNYNNTAEHLLMYLINNKVNNLDRYITKNRNIDSDETSKTNNNTGDFMLDKHISFDVKYYKSDDYDGSGASYDNIVNELQNMFSKSIDPNGNLHPITFDSFINIFKNIPKFTDTNHAAYLPSILFFIKINDNIIYPDESFIIPYIYAIRLTKDELNIATKGKQQTDKIKLTVKFNYSENELPTIITLYNNIIENNNTANNIFPIVNKAANSVKQNASESH